MKRRRALRAFLSAVVVMALASPAQATAAAVKDPVSRPTSSMLKHITQAERDGAAARMKLQQQLSLLGTGTTGGTGNSVVSAAVASLVATPGGTPDYFGSPNWAYSPPLAKFVDTLPGLGVSAQNDLGQYISVAHPDTKTYPGCDYYEIELRQYTEKLHRDLPATTLRGYVQVNNGTDPNTNQNTVAPDPGPQYLGPFVLARKDRPVRIKFTNKLPVDAGGDLFIPVDKTMMGAGMGPQGMNPKLPDGSPAPMDYSENRATLHLHGGITPWISDGTPHQWITPAGEKTAYPKGVSVQNVPDMADPGDGSQTFFYTNQQSARLMFYHDHSYGITRLNVYAGEAAGYAISDSTEDTLVAQGIIPGAADTIPLIIQDKTFVDATTVRDTDPTWNWGTGGLDANGYKIPQTGDLWYPHVYSPAQNPADLSGMNAFGRWHYGPWFWPPTNGITHPPIPNPYYDPINAPWEPEFAPDVPNPSAPGEAFMDTAMVNGTVFPTTEVDPKAYRLRILNASDDRFWNLQMYESDPTTFSADGRGDTEVKMVPASSAATNFPDTWPTDGRDGGVPDPTTAGPQWIQIANEGGFLPKPAYIDQQPITWIMDPTLFMFGNVDKHSLLVAPAERADVVVDFSKYAGKTLILYNDAPAAFPARDPRLDYYTGAPDRSDTGGYGVNGEGPKVGFGPNTRTVMQIKVKAATPAPAYDTAKLESAFASTVTTPGVFAASQNPIIVPDSRYNSAYAKSFVKDTYARIFDFKKTFRTTADTTVTVNFQPKALQDEMGEAFDMEYGRMSGKLGVELPGTNAGNQNFVLYGYIDPSTEKVNVEMTPMAPVQGDGTQIWKITHNGVDTHPLHFHLFDVQLINRVGWDNFVQVPDDNELGWKDTVRVSPLQDTIVALRPILPKAPFGVPDSVRPLDPTMPLGTTAGFNSIDPLTGQPLATPTTNVLTNFRWEYVWHCHILSHEEMDMMRPVVAEVARTLPGAPVLSGVQGTVGNDLTWTDPTPAASPSTWGNSSNEIGFRVERALVNANGTAGTYASVGTALSNQVTFTDAGAAANTRYSYRVVAFNAAGEVASAPIQVGPTVGAGPNAPTNLTATALAGAQVRLNWTDNSTNERGFIIERQLGTGAWNTVATTGANAVTFTDSGLAYSTAYNYRVRAYNTTGGINAYSAYAGPVTVTTLGGPPVAPSFLRVRSIVLNRVTLQWNDNSNNEQGFRIERSTNGTTWSQVAAVPANQTIYTNTAPLRNTLYYYRVRSYNANGSSAPSNRVTAVTQ